MEQIFYFAYGSNLLHKQMRARCPEAKLIGKASLANWRFGIMDRGYATIMPTDSSIVWGGVWSITAADEKSLDCCEGVSEGLAKPPLTHVHRNALTGSLCCAESGVKS